MADVGANVSRRETFMQEPTPRRLLTDPNPSPSSPSPAPVRTPNGKTLSDEEQKMLFFARQYALEIERHARMESSQGHLSPTDLALMSRLVMFLRYDIARTTTGDASTLIDQARKDHW